MSDRQKIPTGFIVISLVFLVAIIYFAYRAFILKDFFGTFSALLGWKVFLTPIGLIGIIMYVFLPLAVILGVFIRGKFFYWFSLISIVLVALTNLFSVAYYYSILFAWSAILFNWYYVKRKDYFYSSLNGQVARPKSPEKTFYINLSLIVIISIFFLIASGVQGSMDVKDITLDCIELEGLEKDSCLHKGIDKFFEKNIRPGDVSSLKDAAMIVRQEEICEEFSNQESKEKCYSQTLDCSRISLDADEMTLFMCGTHVCMDSEGLDPETNSWCDEFLKKMESES